jgi:transposase InsO family protein
MGKMFLLVIDAYTKWLDVHVTTTSTSTVTIELFRKSFSTYGLPEVVVSDNATNFTSDEFEVFLKSNGVRHVRNPPYHPASNGVVERAVQTLKGGLKKLKAGSIETKVSRFLFAYRVTQYGCIPRGANVWSPYAHCYGQSPPRSWKESAAWTGSTEEST